MAKFCTKCGKPLEDGKKCDCEKENKTEEQVVENNLVDGSLDIFKRIFVNPLKTVKKYANGNNNLTLSLILSLINIIIFGLFFYFLLNSLAEGLMSNILGIGLSLGAEIDFMKTFFAGILGMALALLLIASITTLFASVIFKGKGTFKDYITLTGIITPISSAALIVAIICSFISYKLALAIAFIGAVIYFVTFVQSMIDIYKVNKERISYIVAITIASTYIIAIFVTYKLLEAIYM